MIPVRIASLEQEERRLWVCYEDADAANRSTGSAKNAYSTTSAAAVEVA